MSALPPTTDIKCEKTDIGDWMSAFDPIMSALPPITDIVARMSAFGVTTDIIHVPFDDRF